MPLIPALERLGLGYTVRLCLKKTKQINEQKECI
jgi:hypothetical protein